MTEREYTEPTRRGCKRCGSHSVAWQTGKSGKWYLTEIFEDKDGRTYTEHTLFHSTFCGIPTAHDEEQNSRLAVETRARKKSVSMSKAREDKEAAQEAEYFLGLHDLCHNQREQALDQLGQHERDYDREMANAVSMDYMTEHSQWVARCKRLSAEIAFMKAALGLTNDEGDDD